MHEAGHLNETSYQSLIDNTLELHKEKIEQQSISLSSSNNIYSNSIYSNNKTETQMGSIKQAIKEDIIGESCDSQFFYSPNLEKYQKPSIHIDKYFQLDAEDNETPDKLFSKAQNSSGDVIAKLETLDNQIMEDMENINKVKMNINMICKEKNKFSKG